MTGVLFFEVFEIEGWEIMWVLARRYGVTEIVVELDVLGCNGEIEEEDGH